MVYQARSELPARGQVTIGGSSVPSAGAVNMAVSFGRTYAEPPLVFVSLAAAPGGTAYVVPRALNATTTGFTLYVYNTGPGETSWGSLAVNWLAVP